MAVFDRHMWLRIAFVLAIPILSQGGWAEDGAAVPRFGISRFVVEGNSLLPADEVAAMLARHAGTDRTFSDIQRAVEDLEAAYRAAGYSTVSVVLPEQVLESGEIRLTVQETRLGKVHVSGQQHFDEANLRASLPALREGEAPNLQALSRNLQVANESPAKQVQVILQGSEVPGQVDAAVRVSDEKPWRLFATLDNTGTVETGRMRLGLGAQHANLFNRDHVLTAQYTTAPDALDQVSVYGLGYRIPLYASSDTLEFFAGRSDVSSGTVANLFTVSGAGTVLGARYTRNLPRHGIYDHKATLGLDYRAYENQVRPLGGGASLLPDYTVTPLLATYSGALDWTTARAGFAATWMRNLPYTDKGREAQLKQVRLGAREDYSLWRLSGNYSQALAGDWQAVAAFSGQYTRDQLVSAEQFGAGGVASVRGFNERAVAMDRGYRGSLELYTPELKGWVPIEGANLRLLGFYDFASIRLNHALPGEASREGLASAGVGLRLNVSKRFSLGADYAQVLDGAGTKRAGDDRLHVNLMLSY